MYKRNYHPLIILLYVSNMLSDQQLAMLPKTTKHNWNKFCHKNYYGNEWAENYIQQFEDIKSVFASSFLYRSIRFLVATRKGYHAMLGELFHHKNLLKLHAKEIVKSIDYMRSITKIKAISACKYYGVSKDWYYKEKAKIVCKISPFQRCYRQHPNQLTNDEVAAIENLVTDSNNYGKTKTTLYYHALRNNLVFCGKSTFNKYAAALGYIKLKRFKTERKKGLRATRVFEWLHVDVTNVHTIEDGIQKVAFVKDNFSKAVLHHTSTNQKAGSEFIKNLFQETFEKYGLYNVAKPIHILSDGGSENKGAFLSWINGIQAPPFVMKITAQTKDFPFSNSMSESTHSIYKTEFLHGKYSVNEKLHLKDLQKFIEYYNYHRFPTELYGLTPMEVVEGKVPDKHFFKEQIQEARKNRVATNQKFNACSIPVGCNS